MAELQTMPVDLSRLSSFLGVQQDRVQPLFTQNNLRDLLNAILKKATEYDELKSKNTMLEVESEQMVHSLDRRANHSQSSLIKTQAELQSCRTQLKEMELTATGEKTEKEALRHSNESLTSENQRLNSKVNESMEEKRATLAVLDRMSQDNTRQGEEYRTLTERYSSLRQDFTEIETELQRLRTNENSLKFKEQTAEQELQLLQKNNEWLKHELEDKTSEFYGYRKNKGQQISLLQLEIGSVKSQYSAAEQLSRIYQQRNEELSMKLESSLVRVKDVQDQLVLQEEAFRTEMNSQSRLAELWERSASDAKARVAQIEQSMELQLQTERTEAARWAETAKRETDRCGDLEREVSELSREADRIASELAVANERLGTGPGSITGLGLLSPSAQVVNKMQKSGLNLTELYSEQLKIKQELIQEKRKNEKLLKNFNDLVQELEDRAPQILEQREEYSRLQTDLTNMSQLLQQISEEKEELEKGIQKSAILADDQRRETKLYKRQVQDLSRQVQRLLFEIEEQGFRSAPLSDAEITALNRMLEQGPESSSAVDSLISERLVVFRNIQELQQQNQQQLQITRQLGEKMEQEEEANRLRTENLESAAIDEASSVITQLTEELKSMKIKMESYIRERDMFRRMLSSGVHNSTISADSINTVSSQENSDALRELQSHFDAYRNETTVDLRTLNEQLATVTRERSELHLQVARTSSQSELANERHQMLNGTLDMLRRETDELRKRNNQMQETMAKQDYRTQQIAEELIDSKYFLEGMRSENANLKAERQLWKSIEQRMIEELDSVNTERARLNGLVANLQALQSERERTQTESSSRYQRQLSSLEEELVNTKKKLNEERDESKRVALRKEYENKEAQEKLEALLKQLSEAREALAVAITEKEHLKMSESSLQSDLQSTQDKLAIFQKRTPVSDETNDLSIAQQLELEISDMKVAMANSRAALEGAGEKADQMQRISAAAEEALQEMSNSYDQFKSSMDAELEAKLAETLRLQTRVEDLLSEINHSHEELAQIHQIEDQKRQALTSENLALSEQVRGFLEAQEKADIAKSYYQEDLRNQAEIAQEAQQNYERELSKHADAAQSLRQLREDYNDVRNEALSLRKESELNQTKLNKESTSWQTQKSLYEKELTELRTRVDNLRRQNELLHDQFEKFSSQVQQKAEASDSTLLSNEDNAQEIIKYLRREKEIVDVQYELLLQESKRIKQQLSQSSRSLDETRSQLSVERQKTSEDTNMAAQHRDIMAKMNELNLIRESNVVLRAENEANQARVKELDAKVQKLLSEMQPLEDQIRSLEAESEAKDNQLTLLTQDNERWKNRNQQILQKYERVDPEELQELREKAAKSDEQISALTKEKSTLQSETEKLLAERQTLQDQSEENKQALEALQGKYDKLMQQTRERIRKERASAAEARKEAESRKAEIDGMNEELTKLKEAAVGVSESQEKSDKAKETLQSLHNELSALQTQLENKEREAATEIQKLETELAETKTNLEFATAEKDQIQAKVAAPVAAQADSDSGPQILQSQLEAAKAEIEIARAEGNAKALKLREKAMTFHKELQAERKHSAELRTKIEALEANTSVKGPEAVADEPETQVVIFEANAEVDGETAGEAAPEMKNEAVDEAAIQKRIDEAVEKAKEELKTQSKTEPDTVNVSVPETSSLDVEAVLKAKEEELRAVFEKEKQVSVKQAMNALTREKVEKLVDRRLEDRLKIERESATKQCDEEKAKLTAEAENAKQKALDEKEAEFKERYARHGESVRKEVEMRNKLKITQKDKAIESLKAKLEKLEKSGVDAEDGEFPNLYDSFSETEGHISGIDSPLPGTGTNTPVPKAEISTKSAEPGTPSVAALRALRGGGRGGRGYRGGDRGRGGTRGASHKRPRDENGESGTEEPQKKKVENGTLGTEAS